MSRDWDEHEHPRVPGGTPGGHGGEFTENPAGWIGRVSAVLGGRRGRQRHGPSLGQLQAGLESGIKKTGKIMGGASASAQPITFNNGVKAVRKILPTQEAHREYLGGLVGAAIGAPVPAVILGERTQLSYADLNPDLPAGGGGIVDTVMRVSTARMDYTDVWMGFIEGRVAAVAGLAGGVEALTAPKTRVGRLIGLLDALTVNSDRNPGNYMVTPDGIVGIDMAGGFSPTRGGEPTFGLSTNKFSRYLVARDNLGPLWTDTRLSRDYILSLEPHLEALRPEFERLGHIDWYGSMMLRWANIRDHAKGNEVLS